ncbi:MAG TPA: 2OG-Fe(II) oxygenase [Chitinophagaceae bacterium]|nr:2OG-Fe(II) oxygenase [Chitinophagaceae bacterium]
MEPVLITPELAIANSEIKISEELLAYAKTLCSTYQNNLPSPHITLKNLFSKDYLRQVCTELDTISFFDGEKNFYGSQKKKYLGDITKFPSKTQQLLLYLNSKPFLDFLEGLTGIEGLISDPTYEGGGFHAISKGGFLKVHTDFNFHKKLKLDRRLNVLIYLNENWLPEYGGEIELWDKECKEKVVSMPPELGNIMIFSTTDYSYHGHPDPLNCPEGVYRKSLALYYYSNGRPANEVKSKNTNTNYHERPDEKFAPANLKEKLKLAVKKITG